MWTLDILPHVCVSFSVEEECLLECDPVLLCFFDSIAGCVDSYIFKNHYFTMVIKLIFEDINSRLLSLDRTVFG